jgi:methionyl-tRNA synthetase
MDAALEILPPDTWRYHLMANAPESDDASFTWESLAVSVNKELADTFGNFVNRVLSFVTSRTDGTVPGGDDDAIAKSEFVHEAAARVEEYTEHLLHHEYRKASNTLRDLWSAGNVFWERSEPWKMEKGSDDLASTMRTGVHYVRLLAVLSSPIIPFTGAEVLDAFGERLDDARWPTDVPAEMHALSAGAPLVRPKVLFEKIEPEDIEAWKARFGS